MSERWKLDRIAADIAGSMRFFSRLPVPRVSAVDDPAALPRFSTGAWAVPFAGAVLDLPAAILAALLALSDLPAVAAAALAVTLAVLTTGALHEDGLSDTADGLAGAHSRERRLEIMKDSRIGVFGAAALGLSLILRSALVAGLIASGPFVALFGLLASGAVGRAAMVWVWHRTPEARANGLSVAAGRPESTAMLGALLAGLAVALPALAIDGLGGLFWGVLLAWLAAAAIGRIAERLVGGQTGDILGAVQQVAALAFLVGLMA